MEKKTAKGLCFLCEAPSDAVCDDCGEVGFCGGEHGRLHRGSDESDRCLPFRVERLKNVGRVLRATRDIAPGELVFVEHPLTVGPLHDTAPVCLGCFAQVFVRSMRQRIARNVINDAGRRIPHVRRVRPPDVRRRLRGRVATRGGRVRAVLPRARLRQTQVQGLLRRAPVLPVPHAAQVPPVARPRGWEGPLAGHAGLTDRTYGQFIRRPPIEWF